jgi:Ulp1 family protease
MKAKQYMYFSPISLFGPKIETFDSFDKIPKRIKTQMQNYDASEWRLLKAVEDKIYVCDRAGRIKNK